MMELRFFPIYGLTIGVNYWDSYMDYDLEELEEDGESVHMIQLFFLMAGVSFIWYKPI